MDTLRDVLKQDPALLACCQKEHWRQQHHLELIASENYTSEAVMALQDSVLTNKYAEGYPTKRYYGGCEWVDEAEVLAIERAKALFECVYANVQPHSGSQANAAVYQALMQPGDTLLGMSLNEGGHLTHGCHVNMSGLNYHAVQYGLNAEGDIDYGSVAALADQHQPKLIIAGYSAFSRVIDWQKFRTIADDCGAYLLVDMAHIAGLVAAGMYPSPLPYADVVTTTTHKTLRGPRGGLILSSRADETLHKKLNSAIFPGTQGGPLMHVIAAKAYAFLEAQQPSFKTYQAQVIVNARAMAKQLQACGLTIVSGGTDNHMFLVDLRHAVQSGKVFEHALGQAHITLNKNTVPGDQRSPFQTSGLRIGTPAVTTRGMKEPEMLAIAEWIAAVIEAPDCTEVLREVATSVTDLCQRFPIYQNLSVGA